jgi:hypothetical protein
MYNIKQRIEMECRKQGIPLYKLLMSAQIQSGDYYQAVNGKRNFFPAWRKRIASALNVSEEKLFPEFSEKVKDKIYE